MVVRSGLISASGIASANRFLKPHARLSVTRIKKKISKEGRKPRRKRFGEFVLRFPGNLPYRNPTWRVQLALPRSFSFPGYLASLAPLFSFLPSLIIRPIMPLIMQTTNSIAFKEWAVICDALERGRQTLILRKGGIHEGRDGFRVQHSEFWLFPTYLHESEGTERLIDEAQDDLQRVVAARPREAEIHMNLYVVVTDVHEIRNLHRLPRLAGLHVWSDRSVDEKFHYRQPGLIALTVRAYRREMPLILPDSPHFSGCRSWVDLPTDYSTDRLQPVLPESEFALQRQAIATALSETRPA